MRCHGAGPGSQSTSGCQRAAGRRIGLGPVRGHAHDAGAFLRDGRVEAIHPEPTGYADFAVRFEAAKSRGWPCRCAAADSERGMLTDMVAGLDSRELIELALLLIAVGALSGFLAGVFGIGGGAVL